MSPTRWAAIALLWGGVVLGRLLGGPEWAPTWLGLPLFVLILPVHWRLVNRIADRVLSRWEEER